MEKLFTFSYSKISISMFDNTLLQVWELEKTHQENI